jgi:hypothetical protein
MIKNCLSAFLLLSLLASCTQNKQENQSFELLNHEQTGLHFKNELKPGLAINGLNYMYFFNGGGVAAADFNQDGLVDLYFTSNMGENKMYINEGKLHFKDVTQQAGVGCMQETMEGSGVSSKWSCGASVVDFNNDGMPDIYVSQVSKFLNLTGKNHLFICQRIENGVPVFEDKASEYGLDLEGFCTQAAFFDYDLDGDLDMYQLKHSVHANGTFGQKKTFDGTEHPLSGDKLFRNDDGKYTDVTKTAGINSTVIGYGLGIATGDINLDGWPDLYIGNDFHENDYLYINQGDGTFREQLTAGIMHTSQFSMGVDIADINNDAWSEIISLDMLPEDPYILKSSLGEDDYGLYNFKLTYGYHNQYARNTLQKNNGDPKGKFASPTFSEVGMFAGVHATDWSWATLFMDFDNDGRKDLFISNGIERRMNDIDYANFRLNDNIRFKQGSNNLEEKDLVVVEKMPQIKLANKFFRNTADFRFQDMEQEVKNAEVSYSNGAVYADLDNDGDLDVVVNNLEEEPYVYANLSEANPGSAWLDLKLTGNTGNVSAIGTKAIVYKGKQRLSCEHFPVRGFQSSMLSDLHLGIGDPASVDSILIIWPDRSYQKLSVGQFNTTLSVQWQNGLPKFDFSTLYPPPPAIAFRDITDEKGLDYQHIENPFVEFNREGLIPHMVSREGPALATGDINGDGLEDIFFGSSKKNPSALYLQRSNGSFIRNTPAVIASDSIFEDVDAIMTDLENDGDLDIVVAAGGNEFRDKNDPMRQRAYVNDGRGNFTVMYFEGLYMTASCVLAADINKDGLVDLFFGGRAVPWNYGVTPDSYLLLNRGGGNFENVTDQIGGGMGKAGLVKNGAWTDIDNDGDSDLLLAMEWAPPTVYLNNNGTFEGRLLNDMTGWWNFLLPYDFDGDGDMDILAGNTGENSKLKPTSREPVRMYVNDFDDNQQIEQVLSYYVKSREVAFNNYDEIMKQLPVLKKKYLLAKNFANASLADIFGADKLSKSIRYEANTFQSTYFENTGGMNFKPHRLPDELQYSPVKSALVTDLNSDGKPEVIVGSNWYDCNIEMGRYDSGYGNILTIGANGQMQVDPLGDLRIRGEIRRIEPIKTGGKTAFILARNDSKAVMIQVK